MVSFDHWFYLVPVHAINEAQRPSGPQRMAVEWGAEDAWDAWVSLGLEYSGLGVDL